MGRPPSEQQMLGTPLYPTRDELPRAAAAAKDQGAKAFGAGRHVEALQCYDEALKLAPYAAVLHANRAQTLLKLGRPQEALDAADTTVLCAPTWPRSWQRRGQSYEALGEPRNALRCWQKATDLLPAQSPDKASHEAQIQRLNRVLGPRVERLQAYIDSHADDMPWVRFQKVAAERQKKGESIEGTACARMLRAAEAWRLGEDALWKVRKHPDRPDVLEGDPMAIQHLSNAILADQRVVALRNQDFFLNLNMQIEHDAKLFGFERGPWVSSEDVDFVQNVVLKEVKNAIDEGWQKAKWMLALSIRVAVIKGLLAQRAMRQPKVALQELLFATIVVEFVRKEYADVPTQDRGSCFEPSFERALRALLLDVQAKVFDVQTDQRFLGHMRSTAKKILVSIQRDPSPTEAMRLTFDLAPAGVALSMVAFVYQFEFALSDAPNDLLVAAEAHLDAAIVRPVDDDSVGHDLIFAVHLVSKAGGATVGAFRRAVAKVLAVVKSHQSVWEAYDLQDRSDGSDRVLLPWLMAISCSGFEDLVKDDVVLPPLEFQPDDEGTLNERVERYVKKLRAGKTDAKAVPAAEAVLQRLNQWTPGDSPGAALAEVLEVRCS